MERFSCQCEYIGDHAAIVTVTGEVDLHTCRRLREEVDRLRETGISRHLVFDLIAVPFIDSTGLGVLVQAQKQAEGPLHIAVAESDVAKV